MNLVTVFYIFFQNKNSKIPSSPIFIQWMDTNFFNLHKNLAIIHVSLVMFANNNIKIRIPAAHTMCS